MKSNRIEDYNKVLPVLELYYAVQGEGKRAGMPTVVVRTSGCVLRCQFGEGGFCDSWYTSWHPEKGKYTFQNIIEMYNKRPDITEMMLTGGSPTMHPALVNELTHFANERGIVITMETEGSVAIKTDYPIGLLSISPKLSNSIPIVGTFTPNGIEVTDKMVKFHEKTRLKCKDQIKELIKLHSDFQIKPVIDKELKVIPEVLDLLQELNVNKKDVYFMPAGDNRVELEKSYGPVMNAALSLGFNFTGRPHIIAFDQAREV